ncbi:unnamed protein product [Parajaminaea phylloscopi]
MQARDAQHAVPFYPHGPEPGASSSSSSASLPVVAAASSSSLVPGSSMDPQHGSPISGSSTYPHHGHPSAATFRRPPPHHINPATHSQASHSQQQQHQQQQHPNAPRHNHHHSSSLGAAAPAGASVVALGLNEGSTLANTDPHHQLGGPSPVLAQNGYATARMDPVVEAIERIGRDVSSQLSNISVQMSSLLSMMSQVVEPKRRRFDSPVQSHPPHSADGPDQWQHDLRPVHYRRNSNNPFAFDPAAEAGPAGMHHYHDIGQQQPPPTADGSVINDEHTAMLVNHQQQQQQQQPPPIQPSSHGQSHPGAVSHAASQGYPHEHQHNSQLHGIDHVDANGNANATMHVDHVPAPPSHPAEFYSHPMGFAASVSDTHPDKPSLGSPDATRQRPVSSYGSVRPFTAVDHSQRPPAGIGADNNSSFNNSHHPGLNGGSDAMRVNFDLMGGSEEADREQGGVANGFARPPTRNPAHRFGANKEGNNAASSSGAAAPETENGSAKAGASTTPSLQPFSTLTSSNGIANSSSTPSSLSAFSTKRLGRPSGTDLASHARKKKRPEEEDSIGDVTTSRPGSPSAVSSRPMGDWTFWAFNPPPTPEVRLRDLPPARWRTLHAARVDLQRKTGRTMAKLGRLPLRDYLEVSPTEYLAARKTGRAAYQEWLDPLVRLAKQDAHRVKACTNFIEYTHPMLAQCEQSFKAKQLLQQIIDNAIDESTNAKKKAEGGGGGGGGGGRVGERSPSPQSNSFSSPGMVSNTSTDAYLNGTGAGGSGISRFASPRSLTRGNRVDRAPASGLQMAHAVDL